MAFTKKQMIDAIHENVLRFSYSRKKAPETLEILIEIIKKTLEEGDDILVSGFGKFCVKEKRQRRGRNPATDEPAILDARKVVTFKCSGKLRDKINRKG